MKSRIFLAVLAGVALTGCVTDNEYDVKQTNEKVKIAFESPVLYNSGTRANYYGEIGDQVVGSNTYTYPLNEEFKIFAVQHDGDFGGWASATPAGFNGQDIARDPLLDGWAPKNGDEYYYWPEGKMSFAACSPADMEQEATDWETNNIAYGKTGLTLTNFKVPTDAAKHIDVLFSRRTVNQTKANMLQDANYYSGIPIKFQHALSSIHFSLKNDSGETVVLKEITINGIYDTGTFTENITENSSDYTQYVIKTDTNNGNVAPSWEVSKSSTATYTAFSTTDNQGVEFPIEAQHVGTMLETSTSNTGTNHILLVMPQEIPTTATLTVKYTVDGTAATKTVNLHNAITKDTQSTLSKWEIGTRYIYRLYYSSESASQDRIYFAPATDGWRDADEIAVIELK